MNIENRSFYDSLLENIIDILKILEINIVVIGKSILKINIVVIGKSTLILKVDI